MVLAVFLTVSYSSSLHNIDLSWNVKHLNVVDCNGIVCEDIEYYYQRGMLFAWFFPIVFAFICISIGFCLGRLYEVEQK